MPCRTDPPTEAETAEAQLRELCKEIRGEKFDHEFYGSSYGTGANIQRYTRILCAWCKSNPHRIKSMSLELQMWWRDHQIEDRKHARQSLERKRKAAVRKQAIAKLTAEERRTLLGED